MECVVRQVVKASSAPTAAVATSTTPSGAASTPAAAVQATPTSSAASPSAATATAATSTSTTSAVPTSTAAAVACNSNVVTIPVPIVSSEDIYTYVSVKGSLHDRSCALFGLNDAEVLALTKRFENGSTEIVNGVMINAPPMQLINTLSKLGYKVICSTGEAEIVWTMQREV